MPYGTKESEAHRKKGKDIKQQLDVLQANLDKNEEILMTEALKIPNLTHPDVKAGSEATIIAQKPIPTFETDIKDHLDIGKAFNLFDFESASKITGSKFVYMKNEAVLLELGLINYAMYKVLSKGYTPILTPDLAKIDLAKSCGFQPRDPSEQMYTLEHGNLCLIATSEIALAGLEAESVVLEEALPLKYGGFSHCFRMEAGRGASSKGLYRMHQFSKVEMFAFCTPEQSEKIHNEMLDIQVEIIEELGFSYRVLDMPTLELGASAYRKYDVEIWIPSRKEWGEVTSTSNCTDYQAIRLNSFCKGHDKRHLHTVNGTAVAVPRILLGLLEYGQKSDGTLHFPKCLHKYLGFEKIKRN